MLYTKYYILCKNSFVIDLTNIYVYVGSMYVTNYLIQTESKHHTIFIPDIPSDWLFFMLFLFPTAVTLTEYSKQARNENNMMFAISLYYLIQSDSSIILSVCIK